MFLRAVAAFLILPGTVAFLVPGVIAYGLGLRLRPGVVGVCAFLAGVTGLLWCVREFYVTGQGTLAPWSPPKRLVTAGLYRYSRNPMYIFVLWVLLGWALLADSRVIAGYAAVVALAFHVRIVLGEEPWLARTYGEEWREYRGNVPRWARWGWAASNNSGVSPK